MAAAQDSGSFHGGEGSRALTAASIAVIVKGTLVGDPETRVHAVAPLDRARAHHVAFLASGKYAEQLASAGPGVLLVTPGLAGTPGSVASRVVVDNPHDAMLALLAHLYPPPVRSPGVHPTAVIGRGARIGVEAAIGPHVVIDAGAQLGDRVTLHANVAIGAGVHIGDDCELFEGVTLYPGTTVHDRVRVHAGARLGSDGFGYVFRGGVHEKIPHVGRCIVESDVEIGANSTIDRGSIDDTVVGAGTKIDNLVHIGHNVRIGRLCLLMAQVGIAGSVRIEDGCILAGQVGVSGHVVIGAGSRLAAQAGVFGNVPAGETWSGYPARPHREALRAQAAMFRLPSLLRAIERLLGARDSSGDR